MMEEDETDYIELPFDVGDVSVLDKMFDNLEPVLARQSSDLEDSTETTTSRLAFIASRGYRPFLPEENAMFALCCLLHVCEYLDMPQELYIAIRFECIQSLSIPGIDLGREETLRTVSPAIFNLAVQHISMSKLCSALNEYKTLVKKYQPRLTLVWTPSLQEYECGENIIATFFSKAWKLSRLYSHLKNERPLALFEELWMTRPTKQLLPLLILFPYVNRVVQRSCAASKQWLKLEGRIVDKLCSVKTNYKLTDMSVLEVRRKEYEMQFIKYEIYFGCLGSDTPRKICISHDLYAMFFEPSHDVVIEGSLTVKRVYDYLKYRKMYLPFVGDFDFGICWRQRRKHGEYSLACLGPRVKIDKITFRFFHFLCNPKHFAKGENFWADKFAALNNNNPE